MANKSVSEKIAADEYRTKIVWSSGRENTKARMAYHEDTSRLVDKFKTDALVELGRLQIDNKGKVLFKHSKADLLYEKARDLGHGSGLSEVWGHMQDLDDLLD
jgi:hypothetical protein